MKIDYKHEMKIDKAMDVLWAAGYKIYKDGAEIVEPKMVMVDMGPSMFELFKRMREKP